MIARGEPDLPMTSTRRDLDEIEIPLPPLPAAQDRDPDALKDTRPPKPPTPPPVVPKTELELMLEKHAMNAPPGFSKGEDVVEVKAAPVPKVSFNLS